VLFNEVVDYMKKNYGGPIFNGIGALTKFAYFDCRKDMGLFVEIVTQK
jgi:methylmalonyl-CoA/ethylmalonyl-CoA epimerase